MTHQSTVVTSPVELWKGWKTEKTLEPEGSAPSLPSRVLRTPYCTLIAKDNVHGHSQLGFFLTESNLELIVPSPLFLALHLFL